MAAYFFVAASALGPVADDGGACDNPALGGGVVALDFGGHPDGLGKNHLAAASAVDICMVEKVGSEIKGVPDESVCHLLIQTFHAHASDGDYGNLESRFSEGGMVFIKYRMGKPGISCKRQNRKGYSDSLQQGKGNFFIKCLDKPRELFLIESFNFRSGGGIGRHVRLRGVCRKA